MCSDKGGNMFSLKVLPVALLVALSPLFVSAHDSPDSVATCNAALAKDVTTSVKTQEEDLDFISVVDQKTFEQAKTSNSFGANVPLADDLLRISDNWDQFQQKRTSYFQAIHYTSHYSEGEYQKLEITSPLAYPAWTQCIELLAASNSASGGLYAWKAEDKETAIVVNIYYKVPENTKRLFKVVKLTGEVKTGDAAPVSFPPERIRSEQKTNKLLNRKTVNNVPQDIIATFKAGNFASNIYSAWQPPLAPTTTTTHTISQSQDFTIGIYEHHFRQQQGHLTLLGADLTVPGQITSVVYKGCDGAGCAFVWYVPGGQNIRSPDGKTETVSIATDYSGAADLPLHYTVNYSLEKTVCIGRDGNESGAGCPVRSPSDVLNPNNHGALAPL
jgi:hypothetical protein